MKVDLETSVCIVSGAGAASGKALTKAIAANGALVWILQQRALPEVQPLPFPVRGLPAHDALRLKHSPRVWETAVLRPRPDSTAVGERGLAALHADVSRPSVVVMPQGRRHFYDHRFKRFGSVRDDLTLHELPANSFLDKNFIESFAELKCVFATCGAIVLHHFGVQRLDSVIDLASLATGTMS